MPLPAGTSFPDIEVHRLVPAAGDAWPAPVSSANSPSAPRCVAACSGVSPAHPLLWILAGNVALEVLGNYATAQPKIID
jgi:hypothetical protein